METETKFIFSFKEFDLYMQSTFILNFNRLQNIIKMTKFMKKIYAVYETVHSVGVLEGTD